MVSATFFAALSPRKWIGIFAASRSGIWPVLGVLAWNAGVAMIWQSRSFAVTSALTPSQLHWAKETVELTPGFAAYYTTSLEARFPFTNEQNSPVEILTLEPDCGCTTAEPTRKIIPPGGDGEIVAHLNPTGQFGRIEKHVIVRSCERGNDPGKPPISTEEKLTLVVHVPEPLRVQPAGLVWAPGETQEFKTVAIEAAGDADIQILSLTPAIDHPEFETTLRTLEAGRRYELSVRPHGALSPLDAQLPVLCEFAVGASTGGQTPRRWIFFVATKVTETVNSAQIEPR